jgi:hypothetical protein
LTSGGLPASRGVPLAWHLCAQTLLPLTAVAHRTAANRMALPATAQRAVTSLALRFSAPPSTRTHILTTSQQYLRFRLRMPVHTGALAQAMEPRRVQTQLHVSAQVTAVLPVTRARCTANALRDKMAQAACRAPVQHRSCRCRLVATCTQCASKRPTRRGGAAAKAR